MALTESTMLDLGTTAPDFELTDVVTGKLVRRDDFRDKKALLVMFICTHCPYVKHVEKGLAALGRDYAGKPFGIAAISSNDAITHPDDSPAGLKRQAEAMASSSPISTTIRRTWQRPTARHARRISFSSMTSSDLFIVASSIGAAPATESP